MRYFFCLLVLFLWNIPAKAQDNPACWKSVAKENNIQVYTRKMAGEAYKEIRIEATFSGSIDRLLMALDSAETYATWVYKCTVAKRIKTINDTSFYYYIESDLPFPIANRDLVVHSQSWKEKEVFHYRSKAATDFIPLEKGIIRIGEYESSWIITLQADKKINIEYESKTNPGGLLPAWLVNMAVTTGPLKSMQRLEQFIKN